jgi:diguanylate cyclase (GGDEF)-like protein/PAS domain S-box-containing protein
MTDPWTRIAPEEAWKALFDAAPGALLLVDRVQHTVVDANRSAERCYGHPREGMAGLSLHDLLDPGDSGALDRIAITKKEGLFVHAGRHRRRNGETFPARLHVVEVPATDGPLLLLSVADSTESDLIDPASGLADPRLFIDRLDQSIVHAHRAGHGIGICILMFPRLEGLLDDLTGDGAHRLLHDIGDRLRANLRASDTVARIGNAEFAIIIEGVAAKSGIAEVLRKVTDDFAFEFTVVDEGVVLEPRIGVSAYPHDGHEADMLLENAAIAARTAMAESHESIRFFTGA